MEETKQNKQMQQSADKWIIVVTTEPPNIITG